MSGDGDRSRAVGMTKLAMAATSALKPPAVVLDELDDVADFHENPNWAAVPTPERAGTPHSNGATVLRPWKWLITCSAKGQECSFKGDL